MLADSMRGALLRLTGARAGTPAGEKAAAAREERASMLWPPGSS